MSLLIKGKVKHGHPYHTVPHLLIFLEWQPCHFLYGSVTVCMANIEMNHFKSFSLTWLSSRLDPTVIKKSFILICLIVQSEYTIS